MDYPRSGNVRVDLEVCSTRCKLTLEYPREAVAIPARRPKSAGCLQPRIFQSATHD